MSVDFVPPAAAVDHFAARLAYETDVSDVHADLASGRPGLVVVDVRGMDAWERGHLPDALHLPHARIAERAGALVPAGSLVVTYCWGPGCNGGVRGALAFARLGFQVKEMLGGYEYWVREGFAVLTPDGRGGGVTSGPGLVSRPADALTAPAGGIACAC